MKMLFTDVWQFEMSLSRRLLQWATGSIVTGVVLLFFNNPVSRGIGGQFVSWRAIDGLLALLGQHRTHRQASKPEAHIRQVQARERVHMRRLLSINTGLDVLYVSGGLGIIRKKGLQDDFWRGTGWGIVVQGAFLFVFDLFHALQLRD